MRKQKGFTLIELVVVMVILGILAAFAIPKFYDFRAQSRVSVLTALGGAMMSAAYVAHGAQLAQGLASGDTVTIDGQAVTMVNGYPTADADGIQVAVNTDVGTEGVNGFGYDATCKVTYTAAAANGVPAITVPVLADCD